MSHRTATASAPLMEEEGEGPGFAQMNNPEPLKANDPKGVIDPELSIKKNLVISAYNNIQDMLEDGGDNNVDNLFSSISVLNERLRRLNSGVNTISFSFSERAPSKIVDKVQSSLDPKFNKNQCDKLDKYKSPCLGFKIVIEECLLPIVNNTITGCMCEGGEGCISRMSVSSSVGWLHFGCFYRRIRDRETGRVLRYCRRTLRMCRRNNLRCADVRCSLLSQDCYG